MSNATVKPPPETTIQLSAPDNAHGHTLYSPIVNQSSVSMVRGAMFQYLGVLKLKSLPANSLFRNWNIYIQVHLFTAYTDTWYMYINYRYSTKYRKGIFHLAILVYGLMCHIMGNSNQFCICLCFHFHCKDLYPSPFGNCTVPYSQHQSMVLCMNLLASLWN